MILLVKHTRSDEEQGRRELVGSAAVARQAPLSAALTVVLAANAVLVSQSARMAGAVSFTVFFAAYLIRGLSDLGGPSLHWLGWLVPNGWFLRARAFGGEQW
ncbi:hypothetical protein AB0C28_51290 [Nonomuraea sp. NPDC048892]|uniref:hypothetical protein n=1 Tax=Nonomuraea sp. NPDC048892 TaxID=3154624 RepID=UPI0033EACD31